MSIPKIRIELEFEIHSSPHVLYDYISSPARLSEWFCDKVDCKDDIYNFSWNDEEEVSAKVIHQRTDQSIRYQWEYDEGTDYYLEFNIVVDDLTKDVSLMITDFSEEVELQENKLYWENTIENLKHVLGAV